MPTDNRIFADPAYKALKTATRLSVRAIGGQEAACYVTRIDSHVTIGRYGRPQEVLHFAPVDVAIDLDHEAGDPHILRAMAQALGYVVIALPPANAGPEWTGHLGRVARESGEVLAQLGTALADDGKIDAEEIRHLGLRDHVRDAIEALTAADRALAEIEAEGAR